jgi:hypothetical protein
VPKVEICYIVVSTFFGPSGPPPDPPKSDIFDPPIGAKVQAFLWGMAFSIGAIFGVDFGGRKVGSFCRKLQNFKKFVFGGSGSPRSKNVTF